MSGDPTSHGSCRGACIRYFNFWRPPVEVIALTSVFPSHLGSSFVDACVIRSTPSLGRLCQVAVELLNVGS